MQPSNFEETYGLLLEGADHALGGDCRDTENGGAHEFIDFDTRKAPTKLYGTKEARCLREKGGIGDETKDDFKALVHQYSLLDMKKEVDMPVRRDVTRRIARCADAIIRDAYGMATDGKRPSYEELRALVTGNSPGKSDLKRARVMLKDALADAGYSDVTEENLLYAINRWRAEHQNLLPSGVDQRVKQVAQDIRDRVQKNLLNRVTFDIPGQKSHLEDADFGQLDIVSGDLKRYSGFSLFAPRNQDGKENLRGRFAINNTHPNRATGVDHLFAHEGFPGHHLQNVIMALMERNGKLGVEAKIGTMYTPFHVLQEGWAQVVLEILANGGLKEVAKEFSPDLAVELALVYLQDCAKNDASILHLLEKMPIDQLQELLTTRYCLDPHVVRKMSGGWATSKVFGAMVGPVYYEGSTRMRHLLNTHGIDRVLPVVLHQLGFADMPLAEEMLGP